MADKKNKFDRLIAPPPPLFLGQPERDLVKQVNDELHERIIGQQVIYYAIDVENTNFHPLYGEAIEKTFYPPIHVYAPVDWEEKEVVTLGKGVEHKAHITIHFHKRRLVEDQDILVREGDFVCYGNAYYEIVSVREPKEIWGQTAHKMEVMADCIEVREGLFNAK